MPTVIDNTAALKPKLSIASAIIDEHSTHLTDTPSQISTETSINSLSSAEGSPSSTPILEKKKTLSESKSKDSLKVSTHSQPTASPLFQRKSVTSVQDPYSPATRKNSETSVNTTKRTTKRSISNTHANIVAAVVQTPKVSMEDRISNERVFRRKFIFTKKRVRRNAFVKLTPLTICMIPYELKKFCSLFRSRKLAPGEVLASAGDVFDSFVIVADGELLMTVGEDNTLSEFKRGDVLFENNFLGDRALIEPIAADVVGGENGATILIMASARYHQFVKTRPIIQGNLAAFCRSDYLATTYGLLGVNKVSEDKQQLLASLFRYKIYQKNEIIYKQGDFDKALFVVLFGGVDLVKPVDNRSSENVQFADFGPGNYFGEFSLFMNIPRTTTAMANQRTICLYIEGQTFARFLKHVPEVRKNWRSACQENVKKRMTNQLKRFNAPFLNGFTDEEYQYLAQVTQLQHFQADYTIIEEGTDANRFFMIAHGEVVVSVDGQEVNEMGEGQYFGEIGLVQKCKRTATVITRTPCVMLSVNKGDFDKLFEKIPSVAADFQARLAPQKMTIEHVIYHRIAVSFFSEHLEKEFSAENLNFVLDALDYQASVEGCLGAQEMFDLYIAKEAEQNVNINESSLNTIKQRIIAGDIKADLFDDSVKEVIHLMSTDSLNRFKRSSLFAEFLKTLHHYKSISTSVKKRGFIKNSVLAGTNDLTDSRPRSPSHCRPNGHKQQPRQKVYFSNIEVDTKQAAPSHLKKIDSRESGDSLSTSLKNT